MVWKKALSDTSAAVLLMNNDAVPADVSVQLSQLQLKCTSSSYEVHSLYQGNKSLGTFKGEFTASALPSHDSSLLVASC